MNSDNIIVAIDGYSSCGKSTVAKSAAKRLGFIYVDSGAMYRAVTLYFIENNIDLNNNNDVVGALKNIRIELLNEGDKTIVLLNTYDVSVRIRDMDVSTLVPHVSSIKEVRLELVKQQQLMGSYQNIIMDGRDIGSAVFPNAQIKIFMTADPMVRADRRYQELKATNPLITLEEIFENIAHRDFEDTTREQSPLIRSKDAITLDNTDLNEQDQLELVIELVKKISDK